MRSLNLGEKSAKIESANLKTTEAEPTKTFLSVRTGIWGYDIKEELRTFPAHSFSPYNESRIYALQNVSAIH